MVGEKGIPYLRQSTAVVNPKLPIIWVNKTLMMILMIFSLLPFKKKPKQSPVRVLIIKIAGERPSPAVRL